MTRIRTALKFPMWMILLSACGSLPLGMWNRTPTPIFESTRYGSEQRDVVYCTPENLPQKMDVYYPASGGPWPALIYIHGGSWSAGDKAEGAGWRGMTDQGYLVVSINYRLSAYNIKFPKNVEDAKCAVRYLRAHAVEYNLDPARIGLIGASAGGHIAAMVGVADQSAGWDKGEYAAQSSRVQAVLAVAGIFNLASDHLAGLANAIYFGFDDLPASGSGILAAASPLTYVTPDDPPFLLIHGSRDGLIPLEQSDALLRALQAHGVPADLIVVEGGDHSLKGLKDQPVSPTDEERTARVAEFFGLYLHGAD